MPWLGFWLADWEDGGEMASPTVKAVGTTAAAASGPLTPTMPSGGNAPVLNDLALILIASRDNVDCTSTDYATLPAGYPYRPAADIQLQCLYKVCAGGEGNPVVGHVLGDGILANIILVNAGTYDITTLNGTPGQSATNLTIPSQDPDVVDGLQFIHILVNNDTSDVAAVAVGGLTPTERFDDESNLGSDKTNACWTAPNPGADATGAGSFTTGVGSSWCVHWSLRPAAAGGATEDPFPYIDAGFYPTQG